MLDLLPKAGSPAAPAPRVLLRSVQADTSTVGCRHPRTSCSQPTFPISCSQLTKASPQMQGQHTEHLKESGCRGASASDWEHKAGIAHAVGACQKHPTDTHLLQQVSAACLQGFPCRPKVHSSGRIGCLLLQVELPRKVRRVLPQSGWDVIFVVNGGCQPAWCFTQLWRIMPSKAGHTSAAAAQAARQCRQRRPHSMLGCWVEGLQQVAPVRGVMSKCRSKYIWTATMKKLGCSRRHLGCRSDQATALLYLLSEP